MAQLLLQHPAGLLGLLRLIANAREDRPERGRTVQLKLLLQKHLGNVLQVGDGPVRQPIAHHRLLTRRAAAVAITPTRKRSLGDARVNPVPLTDPLQIRLKVVPLDLGQLRHRPERLLLHEAVAPLFREEVGLLGPARVVQHRGKVLGRGKYGPLYLGLLLLLVHVAPVHVHLVVPVADAVQGQRRADAVVAIPAHVRAALDGAVLRAEVPVMGRKLGV